MQQSIEARAAAKGFTLPVFVESGADDLQGFIRPDTDFDGQFVMICGETGDTLRVFGWLCGAIIAGEC